AKESEVQNTPALLPAQKRKGLLDLSFLCRITQDIIEQL
ncbi:MAG: hypothetical protein ACJART_002895, partial [Maribacter sp.]